MLKNPHHHSSNHLRIQHISNKLMRSFCHVKGNLPDRCTLLITEGLKCS